MSASMDAAMAATTAAAAATEEPRVSARKRRRGEAKAARKAAKNRSQRESVMRLGSMEVAPTGVLPGPGFTAWAALGGRGAGGLRCVHTAAADVPEAPTAVGVAGADLELRPHGRYLDGFDQLGQPHGPGSPGPVLRHALPYGCVFASKAKRRWVGKGVLELLASEFSWRPREYWDDAAEAGLLTVDGKPVGPDSILEMESHTRHLAWRFEPPVLARDPRVLAVTRHCVAVEKPASLSMHPGGGYAFLTLQRMLECRAPWLGSLRAAHRLDRVTGGVVLLARTADAARWLSLLMQRRSVSKTYVALVRGAFPSGPDASDDALWTPGAWEVPDRVFGKDGKADGTESAFPTVAWPPALETASWAPAGDVKLTAEVAAAAEATASKDTNALVRWVRLPEDSWSTDGPAHDDAAAPTAAAAAAAAASGASSAAASSDADMVFGRPEDATHVAVSGPLPRQVDEAGAWLLLDLPLALERGQTANGGVIGTDSAAGASTPTAESGGAAGDASEGGMEATAHVRADGKVSRTLVRRIAKPFLRAGEWWTLVAARPLTGRTHQIRAHLAAVGHGIGNDPMYGDPTPLPGAPHAVDVAPRKGFPDPEAAALEAAGGDPAAMPRCPPWCDPRVNAEFSIRKYTPPAAVTGHTADADATLQARLVAEETAARERAAARSAEIRAAAARGAVAAPAFEKDAQEKLVDAWADDDDVDYEAEDGAGVFADDDSDDSGGEGRAKRARLAEDAAAAQLRLAAAALSTAEPLAPTAGSSDPSMDLAALDGFGLAGVAAARDRSWLLRFGPREDFSASQLTCLGVWLHSVRYRARGASGHSFDFGCGLPSWAQDALEQGERQGKE
ncbi:hypothetical protein FNF27_05663 [Cafeteria roenbergensis]|uniref:Pseudouridine synthase RsuA/RluA-like domain-containing protein n=3 Tax=Cafeteria roenbergensis TaxID=33653 RepID=A0A5A8E4U6_CAFRO|nr:hypothetical protein FNF27_05663 [Cafeteria roenbergensis]